VEILHHENHVLVVNKRPGLPTTGRSLEDPECLQFQLEKMLGERVWALHQLDKETSGAVLFVTRKSLVQNWQQAWSRPENRKVYLAVCEGVPAWNKKKLSLALTHDRAKKKSRPDPEGKEAITGFELLDAGKSRSLISARLFTGRTHQVRVHVAHLGHPIVGDARYGKGMDANMDRSALHCWKMEFSSPKIISITCAPPADMVTLCQKEGLKIP
jgi:23S rRNA-/tRNA-specific pseudouridylate synthase